MEKGRRGCEREAENGHRPFSWRRSSPGEEDSCLCIFHNEEIAAEYWVDGGRMEGGRREDGYLFPLTR